MRSCPLVSAVIPTFNYGRYICDAVESALAQTYPNLEVIVVDDGSTDDTRERLNLFGDRITYMYQDNKCVAAARNRGIRAARGEWIALLDSDDVWAEHKIERQLAAAVEHDWQVVVWASQDTRSAHESEAAALTFEQLLFVSPSFGSYALILKKCFDDVGLFDESLTNAEDRDMMLRLGRRFRIGTLHEDCVYVRRHAMQKSYNAERMEFSHRRVVQKALGWPEMRHRYLLRMKLLSCFYWDSANNYFGQGDKWRALGRLILTLACFPLPTGRTFVSRPLRRLKLLLRIVLGETVFALLAGKKAEPVGPGTVGKEDKQGSAPIA